MSTALDNVPARTTSHPLSIEASLCQVEVFGRCWARQADPLVFGARSGLLWDLGSGSDRSEEPAAQDVEPVTLDI